MSTLPKRRTRARRISRPLGTVAAGAIAAGAATTTAAPAQAWEFPAEEIAREAEVHAAGSHGGQCKVFAQMVVNKVFADNGIKARVTGYGTPGGAYFGAYERAGGLRVAPTAGQRGDLIQVITPSQRTKDFPDTRDRNNESILHTAIIVDTLRPGVYRVTDSNYVATETIGTHRWNPLSWRKRGVEVYVWRFGRAPDPVIVPSAFVAAGARAISRTLSA